MEELKKFFKRENSMVIFVTHDIDEAIFIGDEIYNWLLYPYFPIPRGSEFYESKGFQYIQFSD